MSWVPPSRSLLKEQGKKEGGAAAECAAPLSRLGLETLTGLEYVSIKVNPAELCGNLKDTCTTRPKRGNPRLTGSARGAEERTYQKSRTLYAGNREAR